MASEIGVLLFYWQLLYFRLNTTFSADVISDVTIYNDWHMFIVFWFGVFYQMNWNNLGALEIEKGFLESVSFNIWLNIFINIIPSKYNNCNWYLAWYILSLYRIKIIKGIKFFKTGQLLFYWLNFNRVLELLCALSLYCVNVALIKCFTYLFDIWIFLVSMAI